MSRPAFPSGRATPSSFDQIPVVDLSGTDDASGDIDRHAAQLCRTCHEVGFLVITGHGVPQSLIDDVFDLMHRFFALDDETKRRIDKMASPHFRGWEAVGSEFTNNRVDVREQIDAWSEWPTSDADEPHPLRLLGPNQWMPDDIVSGHREITLRWMRELGTLADRLLSLLAIGLGLAPDHFVEMFGARSMSLTKLIHYPSTPEGGAGVNAHHDTGFLTLLAPGPTPGLQIRNPDGEWIDAPSIDGAFVVNIGEMLQAITGNYLVATPHRVITGTERYAAGYFHGPSLDAELRPLPLDHRFTDAVAASPRHRTAGFMASIEATEAGVDDMAGELYASTYGEQLWNYFRRSYPDNMARHHPDV